MKQENYLIRKEYFIREYEKFYDHQWVVEKELSKITLKVGQYEKYAFACNYNKEWYMIDTDSDQWVEIEPIMLPYEIYEEKYKMMDDQLYLNDVEKFLKEHGASDEFILDLCELTDLLREHCNTDIKQIYN